MTTVSVINQKQLDASQEEVLERFIEFQKAMIDKDLNNLNEIINENYTLTHMSGKKQTKQEFIEEIMNGTLNYYMSTIDNPTIILEDDNKAILKADVTLDAKVYGIRGTWTLHSQQSMEKINNNWYMSSWEN